MTQLMVAVICHTEARTTSSNFQEGKDKKRERGIGVAAFSKSKFRSDPVKFWAEKPQFGLRIY